MIHNLICDQCQTPFVSLRSTAVVCSHECRARRRSKLTGRVVHENKISTSSVGAMSELFVSGDLLRKGYAVFRSLSPACFCDLIATKDGKFLRIEVRTGYLNQKNGKMYFPKNINGKPEFVDFFGIYERNLGQIFYFDKKLNKIVL